MRLRSLFSHTTALLIGVFLAGFSTVLSAWTGPSASAPNSNIAAPINVGTTAQVKNGDLGVNSFTAFGDAHLVSGWNPTPSTITYLNFSNAQYPATPTWGSSGYGIRDNNGTLEFKNSGNTWQSLSTIVQNYMALNGQWTTSGSNIYYNGGNVGIGNTGPGKKLDVTGDVRASGEITGTLGTGYGQLRMIAGSYGSFWRNDGANTYLLLTASGDQYGQWNSLRPLYINDASGAVTIGTSLTYPDGTTQTSAAKGISSVTTASCQIIGTASCSVGCPGGYNRTGCSVTGGSTGATAYPSGSGCGCDGASNGFSNVSCYAYCAK